MKKILKNPRVQNCSMLKFALSTIAIPLSYKNNGEGSKSDLYNMFGEDRSERIV